MTYLLAENQDWLTIWSAIKPNLIVLGVAFVVSLIATPVMRELAIRNGIIDKPDFKRKVHEKPIAYLGGVSLYLGWLVGILAAFVVTSTVSYASPIYKTAFPIEIVLGATVIVVVGLIDDVWGISPRVKIGGSLFAAACVASLDVGTKFVERTFEFFSIDQLLLSMHADQLQAMFGSEPGLYLIEYTLGAIMVGIIVVGATQALNQIDGLDGLAAGVTGLNAFFWLILLIVGVIFVPMSSGTTYAREILYLPLIMLAMATLGTVLGYLPYNFNPASIFMGDTGALFLGYLCAAGMLMFAKIQLPMAPVFVTAGLMIFGLPIFDSMLKVVRKKMRGDPLGEADRFHLHHQLLRNLGSVKRAVVTLYGISTVFALFGLSMVILEWRMVFPVFLVCSLIFMIFAAREGVRQANEAEAREQEAAKQAEHSAEVQASSAVVETPPVDTQPSSIPTPDSPAGT